MPTKEEYIKQKPKITILVNGMYGYGKSYFGMTFPKVYCISTDIAGVEFIRIPENIKLLDNLVKIENITPVNNEEYKAIFSEKVVNGVKEGKIYQYLNEAKQLYKEGKVETLFIDQYTDLSELHFRYQEIFDMIKSSVTGNVDLMHMYGNLKSWLYNITIQDVLTFPGNVIAACHIKRESEDTIEGMDNPTGKRGLSRAGVVDKDSDIKPALLGGFRFLIEGKFGASLYLDMKIEGGVKKRIAYCGRVRAFNTWVNAKNRYGMTDVISDASYPKIMAAIKTI